MSFHERDDNSNDWTTSPIRIWLEGDEFYGGGSVFSTPEKTAIASTDLVPSESDYILTDPRNPYKDYAATDHVFLLSAAEADVLYADDDARRKENGRASWWLRSAVSDGTTGAGVVYLWSSKWSPGGDVGSNYIERAGIEVSPALNVNLSSVLFASASGADKSSALAQVQEDASSREWKLTLLDSGKTVNVTAGQNVTRQDASGNTTITVPYTYTDAAATDSEKVNQISLMITDKAYTESDAQVLYYGALQEVTISETTGTGTFTLPGGLPAVSQVYIIAEHINSGNATDYASAPVQITIPPSHIHSYGTEWKSDETNHWHECACGDKKDTAAHTEDSGTITKQPTETETGIRTYKCSVCQRELRTEEVDKLQPSHTHSYGTEWKSDETNHWHECACGDKKDTAAHTEDSGTITTPPTDTATGVRTYKCTICGYEIRTESIPATGGGSNSDHSNNNNNNSNNENNSNNNENNSNNNENNSDSSSNSNTPANNGTKPDSSKDNEPKTGDDTPLELYATLAMIAGFAYLLLYFADRRRGMAEETKQELISRLVGWAKRGGRIRKCLALAVIFVLSVYYHSIGKKMCVERKEIYGE